MAYNFQEIMDRIKRYKGLKSDNAVAKILNLSRSAFSERKKRGSIPYEELAIFCEQEGISFDWLFTGEGPIERTKEKKPLIVSENAIYNEIAKLEERIEELKKAVGSEKPPIELTEDEREWLEYYRNAKKTSPEKLDILIDVARGLGLMPKEVKLKKEAV